MPRSRARPHAWSTKILKGANAGELPVERPIKLEFVMSLKTAKQIGLTIPPNVLARAAPQPRGVLKRSLC